MKEKDNINTFTYQHRESIPEDEYNRIYYYMTIDDFNTSYPSQSRIKRIAMGIDSYLRYKERERCKKGKDDAL